MAEKYGTAVTHTRRKKPLQAHIVENVAVGGAVYTDALMSYMGLQHKGTSTKSLTTLKDTLTGASTLTDSKTSGRLLKRGLKGTYVSR